MSWILEEEITKIIDLGSALGFDFDDKEVRMSDVIAKAISKLKGVKLKMANKQLFVFPLCSVCSFGCVLTCLVACCLLALWLLGP